MLNIAKFFENVVEEFLFASRWFLAPFYIGLIGGLAMLLVVFVREFIHLVPKLTDGHGYTDADKVILGLLGLVDISLVANLLLMIIFVGYENFVSRLDPARNSKDMPEWMEKTDYSGLKSKVMSSIVAVSIIELLKIFFNIESVGTETVLLGAGLHMIFVISGLLFAVTELMQRKAEAIGNGLHRASAQAVNSSEDMRRLIQEAVAQALLEREKSEQLKMQAIQEAVMQALLERERAEQLKVQG